MKLLLYSIPNEPITSILLKHQDSLQIPCLNIKRLLSHGEIYDSFDEFKTEILWKVPGFKDIKNSSDLFLINRICGLPLEWFDEFDQKDQVYAQAEFWAYLTFALNSFPNITERPGAGSLFGSALSLPLQWDSIGSYLPDLKIPEYFFGPLHWLPRDWGENTVFSNPFHFYEWKPNICLKENEINAFAFKRPEGDPVLTFNYGGETLIFKYNEEKELSIAREKIVAFSTQIHSIFRYYCSEVLFFVNENEITFGMASNIPWGAFRSPKFEKIILRCLNKNCSK